MSLAVLLMVVGVACGGNGDTPEADEAGGETEETTTQGPPTTMRMAMSPWIGYGPFWIADEKGFDIENGVDIEISVLANVPDFSAAIASGQVDSTSTATNFFLDFISKDMPLKVVLFEDFSDTGDGILARPGIESISDLKGKKVAAEEGGTPELVLLYALREEGLSTDDLEIVRIPSPEAGTAAIAGRVDAAATYQPFLSAAQKEGNLDLIYTAGERPGLISDVLAVTESFANENPDAVVAALKAWDQAVEFLRSNPDEGNAIVAEAVGLEEDLVAEEYEGIPLFDLRESHEYLTNDFVGLMGDLETLLREEGLLEGEIDIESAVDTSFGERALEER